MMLKPLIYISLGIFFCSCSEKKQTEAEANATPILSSDKPIYTTQPKTTKVSKSPPVDYSELSIEEPIKLLPQYPKSSYTIRSLESSLTKKFFPNGVKLKIFKEEEALLKPYEGMLKTLTEKQRAEVRAVIWQKESIAKIARDKIKSLKGDVDKLYQWRMQWNENGQKTLDEIYRKEKKLLNSYSRASVNSEAVEEFQSRIKSENPELYLSDLKNIEQLLRMNHQTLTIQEQQKMAEIHQQLSRASKASSRMR